MLVGVPLVGEEISPKDLCIIFGTYIDVKEVISRQKGVNSYKIKYIS